MVQTENTSHKWPHTMVSTPVHCRQRNARARETERTTKTMEPVNPHTCQLVSREMPDTIRRIPGGLRERGGLKKRAESMCQCPVELGHPKTGVPMASVVIIVATWTTLLCKLDNNVGSHKRLSIKVRHSILSILGALKFDESKA